MTTDRSAFRRAIERHSLEDLIALFREDAVLHSPITFQPFEGKAAVRRLLGIIFEVFEDFRYTDELDAMTTRPTPARPAAASSRSVATMLSRLRLPMRLDRS